jgi:hypothetical protein
MSSSSLHGLEDLELRRHFAASIPVAINFNDEALSDDHFAYAVAESKKLGVTSVRIWLSIKNYDDRPTAWDTDPMPGAVDLNGQLLRGGYARTINRLFELKHLGFNVMVAVSPDKGIVPSSPDKMTGFMQSLVNATQTPTGTERVRDVVDTWEIGNEVESTNYWADSAAGATVGIKSYVDKLLLPASSVLHSGATWEKVVSAGPAWNPDDLNTLLSYLQSKGQLSAIDYAGYHPYGSFNPDDPASNQQATRILAAKSYADSYGMKMMATEWNVRGFGTDGANDATWARAMDANYRNYILPNFEAAYYFCLVNNWAGRGGTTSARPGGVLEHTGYVPVTPSSDPDLLSDYFASTLVETDPFLSTFNSWQYGTISGTVTKPAVGGNRIFIDLNNNAAFDYSEPSALTDGLGNYTLKYTDANVPVGNYTVRIAGSRDGDPAYALSRAVSLRPLSSTLVNFDLTVAPGFATPIAVPVGSISGVIWNDVNGDGVLADGERDAGAMNVYLDLNNDGARSASEPVATSAWDTGAFSLSFPAALVGPSFYRLRVEGAAGPQTATPLVRMSLANQQIGYAVGLRLAAPPPRVRGSISGVAFSDANANGIQDIGELPLANRIVYLDANNNGTREASEYGLLTNSLGAYQFRTLPAGAYTIRLVPTTGETWSPAQTFPQRTLATDERVGGINLALLPADAPASIAGIYFNDLNGNGTREAGEDPFYNKELFVDANDNGLLDTGETSVFTALDGTFAFTGLKPGTYRIRRILPLGWQFTTAPLTITVGAGQNVAGLLMGAQQLVPQTGSISGYAFYDDNFDGVQNGTELRAAGKTIYLDLNGNNVLETGEKNVVTDANGWWSFSGLLAGDYHVRRVMLAGYTYSTPSIDLTLASGQSLSGYAIGSKLIPTTTSTASVKGYAFNDTNKNGKLDTGETRASGKTVFLDLNANNKLDTGEKSVLTDTQGNWSFLNLAAGTYHVRRVFPTGYTYSTKFIDLTLTAGQAVTSQVIGSKLA